MSTSRVLLVAAGIAVAGYGGWLLWPQLPAAAGWLLAGPVVHDLVVAPVVGVVGLLLGRALPHRVWRSWVLSGLTISATLLLIALPLLLRPHPAAPNPGLQDRDYLTGLAWWLAVLWASVMISAAVAWSRRPYARRCEGGPEADEH